MGPVKILLAHGFSAGWHDQSLLTICVLGMTYIYHQRNEETIYFKKCIYLKKRKEKSTNYVWCLIEVQTAIWSHTSCYGDLMIRSMKRCFTQTWDDFHTNHTDFWTKFWPNVPSQKEQWIVKRQPDDLEQKINKALDMCWIIYNYIIIICLLLTWNQYFIFEYHYYGQYWYITTPPVSRENILPLTALCLFGSYFLLLTVHIKILN